MEWIAFYTLEPFGGETGYIGHAITASTVANVNRPKGARAHKVDDFMPKFRRNKKQSVDEMLQIAQTFTAAMGGQDLREFPEDE
jgi:hypothetical protein